MLKLSGALLKELHYILIRSTLSLVSSKNCPSLGIEPLSLKLMVNRSNQWYCLPNTRTGVYLGPYTAIFDRNFMLCCFLAIRLAPQNVLAIGCGAIKSHDNFTFISV